ncbi:MAG: hypothetical protein JSU08_10910 [Acidobacteria bacterium]|nr:hypothetical protein [Acidobacteriota bacterium]
MSRWIPPSERRQAPRAPDAERPTTGSAASIAAEPSSRRMRWVKRGAAGVAIVAASRLLWQMSRPVEWSSSELPAELEDPEVGDEPS